MSDIRGSKITGCNLEECKISEGGGCLQDYEDAAECDQAIVVVDAVRKEFDTVNTGFGLSLADVATIQQDRKVPTGSLIGTIGSGKTTFLAMLFHRFFRNHKGFDGHIFMDSETFLGLNRKLHYADIKSKKRTVQMPRTSLEEEAAFHFATKDKSGVVHESIWIDIPGEAFDQRFSKGVTGWHEYRGLARSSHVALFLDLEMITDAKKRGSHVEQSLDALAYSIQSKTWSRAKLIIVFSKADEYANEAEPQIEKLKKTIRARFNDDFKSIQFCELHSLGKECAVKKTLGEMWRWIHS